MLRNSGRSVRGLFPILGIAVLLATGAHGAAGEKGSWEFGLYGGYVFFDDYEGTNPKDDSLYGIRVGYFTSDVCSIEGSAQRVSTETDVALPLTNVDFNQQSVRLNGLYNFNPGSSFRPFLTAGLGAERWEFQTIDRGTDVGVNVGGGLRWFVVDGFGLRADAKYVYTPVGSNVESWQGNLETTIGALWTLGGGKAADTDGDGVNDKKDDCPDTPKGATVDKKGCPTDADGDKVFDGIDKCPDTKAGCPVDASGCPLDSDGDGVIDCDDQCKDTAKGCKVDAKGCAPDEDKDGVCDASDKCPGTKSGCKVDATGCPADEDKDGVCDGADKCPGTKAGCKVDASGCPADEDKDGVCDGVDKCAGTPGGKVDETGCETVVEKETPLVLEGVQFEVNSDKLTAASSATLDRVAESLKRSPNVRVEVGGHSDSSGADAYNQTLSQKRAEAVRAYLVSKGVDGSRVTAKGYGESKPVGDNKTAEGKARNRRVELRRLD